MAGLDRSKAKPILTRSHLFSWVNFRRSCESGLVRLVPPREESSAEERGLFCRTAAGNGT